MLTISAEGQWVSITFTLNLLSFRIVLSVISVPDLDIIT